MTTDQELLTTAYRAFNTRNLEAALATMHPEVAWPNTMEGGYVYGHEGVSAYWTKQWNLVDPHVDPLQFTPNASGHIVVEVHQVVHDLQGHLLEDVMVQHLYRIEDCLIRRMEMGADRRIAIGRDAMKSE
jgi:hypothetical protein